MVLNVEHTELFCTACKDYVYSGEFDALRLVSARWRPSWAVDRLAGMTVYCQRPHRPLLYC